MSGMSFEDAFLFLGTKGPSCWSNFLTERPKLSTLLGLTGVVLLVVL